MLDPNKSFEFFQKAEAASDVGRFELAQSFAAQSIAVFPASPNGYGALSRSCIGLGQFVEAEKHCLQGLEKDPNDLWLMQLLVLALRCERKFEEATTHARRLIELAPEVSESRVIYGKVFSDRSLFADAIKQYREARRLDPNNADAVSGLGYCYLNLDAPEMAEQCYRDSLSLNPGDARDLNNLGVALQEQGKLKAAALAYKAAVMADPSLEVSKSNAKASIAAYLSVGGGAIGLYLLAKLAFVAGKGSMMSYGNASKMTAEQTTQLTSIIGLVILSILVLYAIFAAVRRRMKKTELRNADPQILEFYKAVCNDSNVK